MPNPHGSFIWYELVTPEPEGAKTFYDAVVGWKVGPPSQEGFDYREIQSADGSRSGGVMRLTDEMRGHGGRPMWLGYIGVNDVDATLRAIEGDGGKVIMPAFEIPQVGRIALLADPQGAPFYIMRGESEEESSAFSMEAVQHVHWNELSTSDPDAAISFYARHFGWTQEGQMDMGEMGQYRFIQQNGAGIGAVMPKMPEMPVGRWSFYIGVDNIDRAVDAIGEGGGTLLNGPMEIPGGNFALNAVDPQGAAFGLVGRRKNSGSGHDG